MMSASEGVTNDAVWFKDVVVFNSKTGKLTDTSQVLVKDGLIDSVTLGAVTPANSAGATIIDCKGRTLIPGLIDAHWHSTLATISMGDFLGADPGFVQIAAGKAASETLLRGFTTVRDAGGPSFGLKRAIDSGLISGPRMYPSGAFISQSGGHGDFRSLGETPRGICGHLNHTELIGATVIADGVDEVLRGAREQLMHGASQIKMMAGGGVSSPYDPIDVSEFTVGELRAGVECAENFGTYVMVHAFTNRAVRNALEAGVKCIDHGHLINEETVEMIAKKGAFWSLQPILNDADAIPMEGPSHLKELEVDAGTDNAYNLAKKHGINVAWGTDTLFSPSLASRQGEQLAKMTRWYTPAEVLTMATLHNANLLALSGARNPYQAGPLGVVEAGALADLLLIDGNPLADINLIAQPDTAMVVIMKDGKIVKNIVAPAA
jgi:imidazolonepropionase-like amidohydrolase